MLLFDNAEIKEIRQEINQTYTFKSEFTAEEHISFMGMILQGTYFAYKYETLMLEYFNYDDLYKSPLFLSHDKEFVTHYMFKIIMLGSLDRDDLKEIAECINMGLFKLDIVVADISKSFEYVYIMAQFLASLWLTPVKVFDKPNSIFKKYAEKEFTVSNYIYLMMCDTSG